MALAIMMCFLWVEKGMYEMIDVLMLLCAVARMDYCCLICYDFNILINFLQYVNLLGLAIQDNDWNMIYGKGPQHRSNNFASTVLIMCTTYYFVALVLSFYAYRHWKAQLQDMVFPADGSEGLMAGMGGGA